MVVEVVVVGGTRSCPRSRGGWASPRLRAVTLPGVAAVFSADVTCRRRRAFGLVAEVERAALPITCGVAIDVPLMVLVAVSLVFQSDVMPDPGANRSTQVPKLEYDARASVDVVAPTVIALGARAGDELHAVALLLPAATA